MSLFNYKGINVYYDLTGEGDRTVLFIHGLGSSHDVFLPSREYSFFNEYRLLFVDLPGFGRSDKQENYDYSMRNGVDVCLGLLKYLHIDGVILVAHSLGGVIAQLVAEEIDVEAFINCEGNLTINDCKLSLYIYAQGLDKFVKSGFDELKEKNFGKPYYDCLCMTDANAVFLSSKMLVKACRKDGILEQFINLRTKKLYIYGERSSKRRKSREYLKETDVVIEYIEDSGHSMMEENPSAFYDAIKRFLSAQLKSC